MAAIELHGPVKLRGNVRNDKHLSAITFVGGRMLVAGDEDDRVQVLVRDGDDYEVVPEAGLILNAAAAEADLEGLAADGTTVYALGSHAAQRKKVDPAKEYAKNRQRMLEALPAPASRCVLATAQLKDDHTFDGVSVRSLMPTLAKVPTLVPFLAVPGKENGLDIEALGVADNALMLGFRGPVLQHGYAVVMRLPLDTAGVPEVLFVDLQFNGIRDLCAVNGGFLVLAGPASDRPAPFELFWWNGLDTLAGTGGMGGRVLQLGTLPLDPGEKGEGLALESESEKHWIVVILCDGVDDGRARRFRIRKSNL